MREGRHETWRCQSDCCGVYARPALDKTRLGRVVDLVSNIRVGGAEARATYVGAPPQEDDGVPFAEKMAQLTAQWRAQQAEARRLDDAIADNLKSLGF